ncbi:MAG: SDR family oxidoreductase [Nakamurella sp.]
MDLGISGRVALISGAAAADLTIDADQAMTSFLDEGWAGVELKRRGQPEEVAAVAFLCSDPAGFVNGSNVRVDSGSVATI